MSIQDNMNIYQDFKNDDLNFGETFRIPMLGLVAVMKTSLIFNLGQNTTN